MSNFVRLLGAALVLLPTTAYAEAVRIHTHTIPLHHISASTAIRTLHWDSINDLPSGIVDVEPARDGRALRLDGTEAGIAGAVQELKLVDVPIRHLRVRVTFALCRHRARLRRGRKTPLAADARAEAFRTIPGESPVVENNGDFDVHVGRHVDTGIHLSAQIDVRGRVTLRGTIDLTTLLHALDMRPADAGSIGQVQLVRVLMNDRETMIGEYRTIPSGKSTRPIYLYVLMEPRQT